MASNFKINQNKIFLNNSSFVKHNESLDDYIIEHNLNSELLNSLSSSPNTSKISSYDLYSNALKYKNKVNDELTMSKTKAKQRDQKDSIVIMKEGLGLLQIPLSSDQKNPITREEVSFLKFDDIEKHNEDLIFKESKSLSLPRLHHKYQILKASYQGMNNPTKTQVSPPKGKMIFDIEVTHNKELFQGLSKKINEERDQSFNNLQNSITLNKKVMVKMPPIRSYPMVKMNKISFKTNKDLDDLESKGQNTTTSGITKITEPQNDGVSKDQRFRIYWSFGNIYTWKPEVRESASFILDGHKGILYGGLGTKIMDDVVAIDFDKMEWEKMNDTGDKYTMGKFGHSAVRYKRKMYVFGGGTSFQSQNRQKECLGEVRSLNLDDFTWTWVKCNGDLIIPRRNHTAETVGKHMIVHGGLNYRNMVLNDVWLFDFAHQKWSQANVKTPTQALAYHSSCSVYYLQRTRLEAYKGLDRKIAENNGDLIKYEGLYIFGGKNAKNEVVKTLYILEIHKTPMNWFEPETFGKPPSARCGNTLNFCPGYGFLIVIGGKDDKSLAKPFCNDICLLNLTNMNWLKIKLFGVSIIPPRAFHSSAIINSQLYIFGGYNSKGYVNNEMNIVEFDAKNIREILKAEKEKKLIKQLQEKILKEKMEKHKKKNNKLHPMMIKEEILQETVDSDEDERGGSFEEISPEINLKKPRKDAQILKKSLQMMLEERNDEIKKNKWQLILDQYNHKNFVSYVPLPRTHQNPHLSILGKGMKNMNKLKRSRTVDNHAIIDDISNKELDLEGYLKMTLSEKNIKVSDTLKYVDKID